MSNDAFDARVLAGNLFPDASEGEPVQSADRSPEPVAPVNVTAAAPQRTSTVISQPASFRRSESWFAGQIARAAARGQRVL
jgi:hypothetical protein